MLRTPTNKRNSMQKQIAMQAERWTFQNQNVITKIKNNITEKNNAFDGLNSRLDEAGEII